MERRGLGMSAPVATALADYHLHSTFSDGEGTVDELAARALELGLSEIGLCDHLVPARLDLEGYGVGRDRLAEYVAAARAAASRHAGLRILVGLEVDYTPDTANEMVDALAGVEIDYAVGSLHVVDDFPFDSSACRDDERWADTDGLYRRYFELVAAAAEWGHFDIVGHLDLPKKFGRRPSADVSAKRGLALDAIADAGLAVELNTGGLSDEVGEIYPGTGVLAEAHARGIPIVFGSDAHRPDEVGRHFDRAVQAAREAGFTTTLRLSDRRAVPLPSGVVADG
jgi:histidinol-phosphatase (PHP family)